MSIIKMNYLEVQVGESTADNKEKKWTDRDVEDIIRCCWNAAREMEMPPYITDVDKLKEHVTPPPHQKDFRHHFRVVVNLMHKYCWSYNWSEKFLKELWEKKKQ